MPFRVVKCVICNEVWSSLALQGLFTYRLPKGRYESIERDFRWCNGCEGFSAVERLPDEEDAPWITERLSPTRCLKCGSTDIFEREPVLHPNCGGLLKTELCDAFVSTRGVYRRYDTEGRFLREDEEVNLRDKTLIYRILLFFKNTMKG